MGLIRSRLTAPHPLTGANALRLSKQAYSRRLFSSPLRGFSSYHPY